jgi:hypothetical protein
MAKSSGFARKIGELETMYHGATIDSEKSLEFNSDLLTKLTSF